MNTLNKSDSINDARNYPAPTLGQVMRAEWRYILMMGMLTLGLVTVFGFFAFVALAMVAP